MGVDKKQPFLPNELPAAHLSALCAGPCSGASPALGAVLSQSKGQSTGPSVHQYPSPFRGGVTRSVGERFV